MTSRRRSQTISTFSLFLTYVVATLGISGCAALPDDAPVVEQLDTETGATVTRLGHPVEVYREAFLQATPGKFAFIGPFETNSMGKRELYLWVALPIEPSPEAVPTIQVNGTPLNLSAPGREADFAGVHKLPYKIPTPWSAMYYFKIDEAAIAQLGDARDLRIDVLENSKTGDVKTSFASSVGADARLKEFSERVRGN
jgi:hypothetical protein